MAKDEDYETIGIVQVAGRNFLIQVPKLALKHATGMMGLQPKPAQPGQIYTHMRLSEVEVVPGQGMGQLLGMVPTPPKFPR